MKFLRAVLKSLNPKYYLDLGEKKLAQSIRYFLLLLAFTFILVFILLIPKWFIVYSDIQTGLNNLEKFELSADLETMEPIYIPQSNPVLVIDTGDTDEAGILTIKKDSLEYNFGDKQGEFSLDKIDLASDNWRFIKWTIFLILVLLPGIFVIYYIAYLIKYLVLIIPITFIMFLLGKIFHKQVELKRVYVLSLYASTIMILLEVLTLPFFMSKYLLTLSPVFSLNFSIIAITAYLTYLVTAIRMQAES